MKALIIGGAGFIGIHLTRRLLRERWEVSVLDNFSPQVHGAMCDLSPDVAPNVTLHRADVRDKELLSRALRGQDVVVHLAADTGTAQSMYEVSRYQQVNIGGTANLVEALLNDADRTVKRIVVASSRAVYGEGKYWCDRDGAVFPFGRRVEDMRSGQYEPRCPRCQQPARSLPTTEDSPLQPASFYGLTKQVQERMVLMFAEVMGLAAIALRYQNVFGPGQSLRNPYTGILAIFANQARTNEPIYVFEDGRESRDFVYINDVVEATWRCMNAESVTGETINVGTGERTTVLEVAEKVVSCMASTSAVKVNGRFREGDIRHNCADISKAKSLIGFDPQWSFGDGLREFLVWAQGQDIQGSTYEASLAETRERGILRV
jgi:dTDP-L-rhamnose 4-epimerase